MPEVKIHDESHKIPDKRGNGRLRREVWIDDQGRITRYNLAYINHKAESKTCAACAGRITRYNLAYINHNLHAGDNGRVVGYDNAHGFHHRHYFGAVEAIDFISYEDVEERFELDWTALKGRK
ncbi:MAG: transcriptional regulator [Proteobacteria bacterium]|nr:transcriptional regulator [Pseudomonadota bacterium]